jgi:hypothetical protein
MHRNEGASDAVVEGVPATWELEVLSQRGAACSKPNIRVEHSYPSSAPSCCAQKLDHHERAGDLLLASLSSGAAVLRKSIVWGKSTRLYLLLR